VLLLLHRHPSYFLASHQKEKRGRGGKERCRAPRRGVHHLANPFTSSNVFCNPSKRERGKGEGTGWASAASSSLFSFPLPSEEKRRREKKSVGTWRRGADGAPFSSTGRKGGRRGGEGSETFQSAFLPCLLSVLACRGGRGGGGKRRIQLTYHHPPSCPRAGKEEGEKKKKGGGGKEGEKNTALIPLLRPIHYDWMTQVEKKKGGKGGVMEDG